MGKIDFAFYNIIMSVPLEIVAYIYEFLPVFSARISRGLSKKLQEFESSTYWYNKYITYMRRHNIEELAVTTQCNWKRRYIEAHVHHRMLKDIKDCDGTLTLICKKALIPEMCNCNLLTSLIMKSCHMKTLPPEILNLRLLNTLSIMNGMLVTIPAGITKMKNVTELHVIDTKLSALNVKFSEFELLTELNLVHNKLITFPNVAGAKNLSKISVSGNYISELPAYINTLFALKDLNLSHNKITDMPDLSNLSNLTILNLYDNKIRVIHESVYQLGALKLLNLGNNDIETISNDIANLTKLEKLVLEGNNIVTLPKALEKLNLVALRVDRMDKPLKFDKSLVELCITNSSLSSVINSFAYISRESNILSVNFDKIPLVYAFNDLLNCVTVTHLSLCYCSLKSMRGIEKMVNLQYLDLSNNILDELTEEVCKLNIFELIISNNSITDISNITLMGQLQVLDARNNNIKIIPENINELEFIQVINLSMCEIRRVPKSMGLIGSLHILILESNLITELSDELFSMESLFRLNIQNNNIVKLPVYAMKASVDIAFNPLLMTDTVKALIKEGAYIDKGEGDVRKRVVGVTKY